MTERKRIPAYKRRAEKFADELHARIHAYNWNELDFKSFSKLQAETWDRVRNDRDPRVLLAVCQLMTPWRTAR